MKSLVRDIRLLCRLSRHPGPRWRSRLIAGSAIAYLFSPIQLIPSFIPVIGQLDDLLVLYVGLKLVIRMTPESVLDECRKCDPKV